MSKVQVLSVIEHEWRFKEGGSVKSRPPDHGLVMRRFVGSLIMMIMVPLERRSRIGLHVVGR